MTKVNGDSLDALAEDIKSLGNNIRFNLCIQLLNTARIVDKYMVMYTRKFGHNPTRMQILYTIIIHGGVMRPSDISSMLFQSKQTVTQILNNLQRDRLVKRKSFGKDGRTRAVFITEKGLNLVKETLPTTLEVANSAIPEFNEEEFKSCSIHLRKIRKHLYTKISV